MEETSQVSCKSEQCNRGCSVCSEDSNCRTKENKLAGHIWAWWQFLHQANLEGWLRENWREVDLCAPWLSQASKQCNWEASAFWRKKKGELGGCMMPSVAFFSYSLVFRCHLFWHCDSWKGPVSGWCPWCLVPLEPRSKNNILSSLKRFTLLLWFFPLSRNRWDLSLFTKTFSLYWKRCTNLVF